MNEPLTQNELEALRHITSPTVCNAIETFKLRSRSAGFMDSSVRCLFPELGTLVGYAVTAKIAAHTPSDAALPPWDLWTLVERSPKPAILVIEDIDDVPIGSFWGEVNGSIYKGLGAAGTITNGGVRDLDEVRATGFHFFASCVLVSHAYIHVVEAGTPVSVGGLVVHTGDLLHADQHGVTSVPIEIARDIPKAAEAVEARERRIIDYARSGDCTVEGLRNVFVPRS
jgi:regulator of RNase E activity RraA